MTLPSYVQLSDIISGYALNPQRGYLSVVVPVAATNLVTNPSFELPTGTAASPTGYAVVSSATIIQTTAQQRRGIKACQVTPSAAQTSSGVSWALTLAAATAHTFSVDLLGAAGDQYELRIVDVTAGTTLGNIRVTGAGRWRRHSITATTSATTSYRLELVRVDFDSSKSTAVFFTDGWQCEATAYATTYCDGDQLGFLVAQTPPAYQWTGTPHASASIRSAQTRAGGRVCPIQETYGLRITAVQGLGLAEPSLVQTPYAVRDGASYQRSVTPPRVFTVAGQFEHSSPAQLQRLRGDLASAVAPGNTVLPQPLLLLYTHTACNEIAGDEVALPCVYAGGLERDASSLHAERVAIRFVMPDPALRSVSEAAAVLDVQDTTATTNYLVERYQGRWRTMGSGPATGTVERMLFNPLNNLLYVAGSFTSISGTSANRIATYNPETQGWAALGTGLNATAAYAIAFGPDGSVYVGGDFTTAGGGAANRIARWNGSAWSALGTGVGARVWSIAIGPDGTLYAAGEFTTAGGGAANRVARWNGTTWSAMGNGFNATVFSLFIGPDGYLYAGGDFTADGTGAGTFRRIARWNLNAASPSWQEFGGGTTGTGEVIIWAADAAGGIYAGSVNGVQFGGLYEGVARWNGTAWGAVSTPPTGAYFVDLAYDRTTGELYIVGDFPTFGAVANANGAIIWNGSAALPLDVQTSQNSGGNVAIRSDGTIALDNGLTSTVTTAGYATVPNPGTAPTSPIITITGPGRLRRIANLTTGQSLYAQLTLNAGETAVLDLTPGRLSFTSSFRGNILSTLLPGSTLADFQLAPGANTIAVYVDGTTSSATGATIRYRPAYASIDDTVE